MNIDNEVREGALNAVRTCMNVKQEDRVIIITDNETKMVGGALLDAVNETGAESELLFLEDYAARPITYTPDKLIGDIENFKPTVSIYAASSMVGEITLRTGITDRVNYGMQTRHAHMVGITPLLMRQGMRADYQKIYQTTCRVYERLQHAKSIHVTSQKGSDFTARIDPELRWVPSHGIFHQQGDHGNLPDGEVFTSPATADGVIVVDSLGDYFSQKYGLLKHPMTLVLVDGWLQSAESEDKSIASEFWSYLDSAENGRRMGEFAIGTNTALTELTGNLLQDEKIPGVHVAFGFPYSLETGAQWSSPVHVDVIPTNCTIQVDGELLMERGKFLL